MLDPRNLNNGRKLIAALPVAILLSGGSLQTAYASNLSSLGNAIGRSAENSIPTLIVPIARSVLNSNQRSILKKIKRHNRTMKRLNSKISRTIKRVKRINAR